MSEAILYNVKAGIATITMNRPEAMNSMNADLIDGLHAALDRVEGSNEVRAVVLIGSGKAFCAGGDLNYLKTLEGIADQKAFIAKVGNVAKRITAIEKPFIACVNAVAAGAGVNLMLACDFIYASEKARFMQAFSKVGLIPDCGGLFFLPKAVGLLKAKELMLTADIIDAATALQLGLVSYVHSEDELEEKVYAMAERMAKSAPLAIGLTKKYLNDTSLSLDEVLNLEETVQPLLMGTEDFSEGVAAFAEKRSPVFKGK